MIPQARFENALRSTDPAQGLRALVVELAAEGKGKSDIYEALEKFLLHLRRREDQNETDEDVVLDVMDALTDWCHPTARLLPDTPPLSDSKSR